MEEREEDGGGVEGPHVVEVGKLRRRDRIRFRRHWLLSWSLAAQWFFDEKLGSSHTSTPLFFLVSPFNDWKPDQKDTGSLVKNGVLLWKIPKIGEREFQE